MLAAKIYSENWEVGPRLLPFRITRDELIGVLQKTLAERSNTIDIDVANAPGTLAYIHGSRHLRLLTTSKGYLIDRERNIESSIDQNSGIKIAYQNVDQAASIRSPKAISGKKVGSADAIDMAQGKLFPAHELPETIDLKKVHELNSSLWYLCASFDEDSFCAELSLPACVKGGNFYGFLERIFIAKGKNWIGKPVANSDDDVAEFEPKIARK